MKSLKMVLEQELNTKIKWKNGYAILNQSLLEFIGYEDEWLLTKAGLNKRTRSVLVDMIIDQRYLLHTLYNKLDEETKRS
ncbi:hypothetical protein KQR56_12305 [Bacillus velezensis]|nr:hypothetical protein [Bacillus velezensis]